MGRTWKIDTHTFLIVWVILSIRFPSYAILHRLLNAWVFSSISHSIGKDSKTHQMGKVWEIVSHTFSIKWVLFSIRFPSCGIVHHMGNAWVFSSISQSMGKGRKTHQMGKDWEIVLWKILQNHWYSYFSHSVSDFFHQIHILW